MASAFPDWTADPKAAALLTSCAANPPATVKKLAPLSQCLGGIDEYVTGYSDADDRVAELQRLSSTAFDDALEGLHDDAQVDVVMAWISVDDAIEAAIWAASMELAA